MLGSIQQTSLRIVVLLFTALGLLWSLDSYGRQRKKRRSEAHRVIFVSWFATPRQGKTRDALHPGHAVHGGGGGWSSQEGPESEFWSWCCGLVLVSTVFQHCFKFRVMSSWALEFQVMRPWTHGVGLLAATIECHQLLPLKYVVSCRPKLQIISSNIHMSYVYNLVKFSLCFGLFMIYYIYICIFVYIKQFCAWAGLVNCLIIFSSICILSCRPFWLKGWPKMSLWNSFPHPRIPGRRLSVA